MYLGVEFALGHRHVDFSGKANASIHGLEEDDTATLTYQNAFKINNYANACALTLPRQYNMIKRKTIGYGS